jgi:drug/metabolite transporter (DMT)-like permease
VRSATVAGLIAILIWGATLPWMRTISAEVGPVSAGAWMCIGAAIVLWGVRLARGRWSRPRVSATTLLLNGALFTANLTFLSLLVGLAASDAESVATSLVNYTWPTLAALIAIVRTGGRLSPRYLAMAALALTGMALAVLGQAGLSLQATFAAVSARPLPYLAAVGASLSWAVYANTASLGQRDGDDNPVIAYLPMAALATGLLAWRMDGLNLPVTERTTISLLILCVVTAISYVGWDLAVRKGNARIVGTAALFTPLLSVLAASIAFGQTPGPAVWLGAALLVGAAALRAR